MTDLTERTNGTPEWLEHLCEAVFDNLPDGEARTWQSDIANALPVNTDFEPIRHRIQRDFLGLAAAHIGEGDEGWRQKVRSAVNAMIQLHDRAARGEKVLREEWARATDEAWGAWTEEVSEAAMWASQAAAKSASWEVSRAAAWTAAERAAETAETARSAAASAAEAEAWAKISQIVLKHLRDGATND